MVIKYLNYKCHDIFNEALPGHAGIIQAICSFEGWTNRINEQIKVDLDQARIRN